MKSGTSTFGGTYCLHLLGQRISHLLLSGFLPGLFFDLEDGDIYHWPSTWLHGITTQKTTLHLKVFRNSASTSQKIHCVSTTKTNLLMLFREMFTVYYDNYTSFHSSGDKLLTSLHNGTGAIPGAFLWDSQWTKRHWSRFFSQLLLFFPA
jgi:hypothetical protein